MSFEIGIPTLNRADLLIPSVLMYKRDYPKVKIHIIDNGNQNLSLLDSLSVNIIKNSNNIGVGASWNHLCSLIFANSDNALILNDDIYLGAEKNKIDDLIKKGKGFAKSTQDWCSYVISKKVFQKVGKFDECFFPAYYEDKSYEYRMKLLGIPVTNTPILNPYVYRASKTLERMPTLLEASKRNKNLYIEMWGGEPTKEAFKTPFNK